MSALPRVELSHVGLWVADLDMMTEFYCRMYDFHLSDRGVARGTEFAFLTLDPGSHHQLVLATGRPAEVSFNVLNQISFKVESLGDVRRFYQALKGEAVTDIRPMTHGNAWSVYFQDPENNRSEIFTDTPWYVRQPFGEPIDLELPEEEIIRRTEEMIAGDQTRRPFDDWREETARKISAG
jgi:catechol 2,3-dioxygenase-like lactoylglutathione lyase family enzyme